MGVPVIDLTGFAGGAAAHRSRIGSDVDRACRNIGFFAVTGHGIDKGVLDTAHREAMAFFDLPLTERMAVAMPEPGYPYGYSPFRAEALNRSLGGTASPDLKETYNIGPIDPPVRPIESMVDPDERAVYAPNLWPEALPSLRPAIEAYYRSMSALARTLMDTFAVALGLHDGWFRPMIDRHGSALRLAHYPALDDDPPPGSFRAGAHTDYGTLTILRLDGEPGLQVALTGPDRSDARRWMDVTAPPGALVVNLGDLMQRWTNDRWRSTMHRVVVPPEGARHRRLTMPFFHNANWDARVECITAPGGTARYEPVGAGAHLMAKFRSTVI